MYRILVINPGSTSTKIALYDGDKLVMAETVRHSAEELAGYENVAAQFGFRRDVIMAVLGREGVDVASISAVVGRGGLLHPMPSGVYEVNAAMKEDLRTARYGEHASNLGGLLAADIAAQSPDARAFIADPVVVDEMNDVARVSGHPLFRRISIFHALNQKAVARAHARAVSRKYEDLNLVVAHLGGGISVGAHTGGRVVDVNNALDGDGAFSPERAGTLPAGQLADICFSGEYTHRDVRRMITGAGGMVAHLGTNDVRDAVKNASAGDVNSKLILEAMCYGVAKNIGAMAAALKGRVDAVILTGGIAHNRFVCDCVTDMVGFIAPVAVYPGEDEMEALAANGLMVLRGELTTETYTH